MHNRTEYWHLPDQLSMKDVEKEYFSLLPWGNPWIQECESGRFIKLNVKHHELKYDIHDRHFPKYMWTLGLYVQIGIKQWKHTPASTWLEPNSGHITYCTYRCFAISLVGADKRSQSSFHRRHSCSDKYEVSSSQLVSSFLTLGTRNTFPTYIK